MKRIYILILFSLLILQPGKAQEPESFNRIYAKTYVETAQSNMPKALQVADSLLNISETPLYKVKSLMLLATLYQLKEDLKKSIEYAEKARTIVNGINDDNWNVRILGFLSTQYRLLQLYDKSRFYSKQALRVVERIKDPEIANCTSGFLYQELAYYDMEVMRSPEAAIKHINQAQHYFDLLKQNTDFFTLHNEQLLGLGFYRLKDYKTAMDHYKKGEALADSMPDNFLKGLVYNGIASVYIETGDFESAKPYIEKADKIADSSSYLQLRDEVYKTVRRYYSRTKNFEGLIAAEKKYDSVMQQITDKTFQSLNATYSNLEQKQQNAESANTRILIIFLLVFTFLLIAGAAYLKIHRKKQKQQLEKFNRIVDELNRIENEKQQAKENKKTEAAELITAKPLKKSGEGESGLMSAETEQKILSGLETFESSGLFINNSLSLSFLASHLQTNSKYLSYIVKTYRKKDFNNYINDLRVQYVMENLRKNEEWQQYKISVLAAKAGFSSHSKFATIFKASTGLSPSEFIRCLNKKAE